MRVVIVTGLLLALGIGAHATVLVPATLDELARDARTIVRGRVLAIEARWAAGRRQVETHITLSVDSLLKGPAGRTLQFRVPGGRIGRYRSVVTGAPHFTEGQRVIVFLGAAPSELPHVLGLSQGVFRIRQDGANAVVAPAPLLALRGVRGARDRRPMPLEAFERTVRTLAARGR